MELPQGFIRRMEERMGEEAEALLNIKGKKSAGRLCESIL